MLVLQLAAAVSAGALPSFAGIQLGAPPPDWPECQRYVAPASLHITTLQPYLASTSQPVKCIELPDPGHDDGMIYFPREEAPTVAGFNMFGYTMIDGKIESLGIDARDYNYATTTVEELTEKYGKPSTDQADREIINNIAVPSRTVMWTPPGLIVEYRSVFTMENGSIKIDTYKSIHSKVEREKAKMSKITPL